jgi:hypothetical protein
VIIEYKLDIRAHCLGATNGAGRVDRHHLAGNQPVEQQADRTSCCFTSGAVRLAGPMRAVPAAALAVESAPVVRVTTRSMPSSYTAYHA